MRLASLVRVSPWSLPWNVPPSPSQCFAVASTDVGLPSCPCKPADHRSSIGADQRRIRTVAFVGPAPAWILDDSEGWREGPGEAGGAHLLGGRPADPVHQLRIVRRAEPDVMREERRTVDIVMPVDRVHAPDHRHFHLHVGRHRGAVEFVRQFQPVVDAGMHVHRRPRTAAVEDRADIVFAHVVGRDRADVGLGDLADLLLERHALDDRADAGIERRVGIGRGRSVSWRSGLQRRACRKQRS